MNPEEIKKLADNFLKSLKETHDWTHKDYISRHIDSIKDLRKFVQDIVNISLAIVGVVIPILLNSEAHVQKSLLILSALLFCIEIIIGVSLRFYVIKKELKTWPKTWEEVQRKLMESMIDLKEVKDNPNQSTCEEKIDLIKERHSPGNIRKLSLIRIFFNPDYWFFGLFIISFILFIISLFYPIFIDNIVAIKMFFGMCP